MGVGVGFVDMTGQFDINMNEVNCFGLNWYEFGS